MDIYHLIDYCFRLQTYVNYIPYRILIVNYTKMSNLLFNPQFVPKFKFNNFCTKTQNPVYKSTRPWQGTNAIYNNFSADSTVYR